MTRRADVTPVTPDPWQALRELTAARIAIGRAGASVPTVPHLEFQMAHARARDAVHRPLDVDLVERALEQIGLGVLRARSAARDRAEYLTRPDLGRLLDDESRARLVARRTAGVDGVFVVADGLSAVAVERHAAPVVRAVVERLRSAGWTLAPLVVAEQGRVAIGDEVGEALGATVVAVLIGERPGLSAPDSLGIYLTYGPHRGRTDAERNCISNVRPEGLAHAAAAHKLAWMMVEARRRGLSGIGLREEAPVDRALGTGG